MTCLNLNVIAKACLDLLHPGLEVLLKPLKAAFRCKESQWVLFGTKGWACEVDFQEWQPQGIWWWKPPVGNLSGTHLPSTQSRRLSASCLGSFKKRRFCQRSHLVNDLRQGSSSFLTFFLRSSVTVGPPMALLLRIGMKMLVTILSMFHNRFSGSLASMNPACVRLSWVNNFLRCFLLFQVWLCLACLF